MRQDGTSLKDTLAMVLGGLGLLATLVLWAGPPAASTADERAPAPVVPVQTPAPWSDALERLDRSLAEGDLRGAERAWREGYTAALGARRWEGYLAVGDAALRVAMRVGEEPAGAPRARAMYLRALFRARAAGQPEGAVRVAEAFASLGDTEMAWKSVGVARSLAPGAPAAVAGEVNALEARLQAGDAQARRPTLRP